jgi:ribosome recycling factor
MHAATSAARALRPLARPTLLLSTRTRLSSALPCGVRHASKKAKGGGATSTLVPGSQLVSADAGAVAAHAATDAKMAAAADWFRREVAAAGARAAGRVSPALLDPVRVALPGGRNAKLEEVATVGVKDGTALLVTVFEEAVRAASRVPSHGAAGADPGGSRT